LFTLVEKIELDMEKLRGPAGILTIAAPEYYCTHHLSTIINTYTEQYPNVRVSLLPLNSIHAIQSIRDHVADLAIIASECDEMDLRKNFLEEEQTLLVASTELSKGRNLQEILSSFPFISYNSDCSFSDIIEQYFKKMDIKPISTIVCGGSDETIKRIVLNNTGYAILGENSIKNELKEGTIKILQKVSKPINTYSINLKVRSEEPNVQTFNDLLQNAWPFI
jgi:DNA-binding transcriptional LysR family regulator